MKMMMKEEEEEDEEDVLAQTLILAAVWFQRSSPVNVKMSKQAKVSFQQTFLYVLYLHL